jgi:hypothetical protein
LMVINSVSTATYIFDLMESGLKTSQWIKLLQVYIATCPMYWNKTIYHSIKRFSNRI